MPFIISPKHTYSRTLATLRATNASRSDCTRLSSATVFASRARRTGRALGKKDAKFMCASEHPTREEPLGLTVCHGSFSERNIS